MLGQTLCEVLCMFTVTQLNEISDNNLHIPSDSAVPVLCCCTKYQQISTAGLLHQCPSLPFRSVDRTNVASLTNRPHSRRNSGWKLQTIFVGKIMSVFSKYRQLIQHIPSTLTVTQTAAVVLGIVGRLRLLLFV